MCDDCRYLVGATVNDGARGDRNTCHFGKVPEFPIRLFDGPTFTVSANSTFLVDFTGALSKYSLASSEENAGFDRLC